MYSYNTSIPAKPVVSYADRTSALEQMAKPHMGGDMFAGLSRANQVDYDRAAQMANQDHMLQANRLQGQMALRGLQQVSQQRQNQQDLGLRRMNMLNSLLSGLYT